MGSVGPVGGVRSAQTADRAVCSPARDDAANSTGNQLGVRVIIEDGKLGIRGRKRRGINDG